MNFVDTHCHLHFSEFENDTEEVVRRAREAGITHLINVGTDLKSSESSISLSKKYDSIYATVGIHPHDAKDATPEDLCKIAALAQNPKVVAIGEVGLDFYRNLSPEEVQKKVLIQFFDIAQRNRLPLVLHIRDAYETVIGLLREHVKPPIRAVSHCFSGTRETMDQLLELGLYISFAGPVTYKKNDQLREAAQSCPLDRILIETDAPFLAPQSNRGKRNEPAFMIETAKKVAELKGLSVEKLGVETSKNCSALFQRNFS